MPVKNFLKCCFRFTECIYLQYNEAINSSKFSNSFKFKHIASTFKQGSTNQKDIYKPISILPLISKIFQKLIYKGLSRITLTIFFRNFNEVLQKDTAHNIVFC